ncbi:hypothetical protein BH160DRAFT_5800 [Burkholderia sp. H160]|nr:hypothetical protein BH160DRAFT_5800 [Burkholderia sp. H160]
MATIFLNIDGVLHISSVYYDPVWRQPRMDVRGRQLWEWYVPFSVLVEKYRPNVVLRSSWTRFGLDTVRWWMPSNLRVWISGATDPVYEYFGGPVRVATEHQVILRHLSNHPDARWVYLGDTVKDWPSTELHHLLMCDPRYGLGNVEKRRRLEEWLASPVAPASQ